MLNAVIHYENANFLRELAENLPPKIATNCKPEQIEFLHRLANDEIAEAEHIEWVRRKVDAARSDERPTLNTAEIRNRLTLRFERYRNVL